MSFAMTTTLLAAVLVLATSATADCGLWLGPSHVKKEAEHGYGLGMYTGRLIKAGQDLPGELFVPIYDLQSNTDEEDQGIHPPLREFMWGGEAHKNLVLEALGGMFMYSPGISAICPCTSVNFNVEQINEMEFNRHGIDRKKHPEAGSFSYYTTTMFRAVRDILPGEELIAECYDDDFDAAEYRHIKSTFNPQDSTMICVDDKVEEHHESELEHVGRGVYTRQPLKKGSIVLSAPAVPVHRSVLEIPPVDNIGRQQLLLNYCFGHPDSDLLWLPYGPLMNSVNHHSTPNVKVVWHQDAPSNEGLARRQQYHHPELFRYSVERVASTHGKGLVIDLVALRDLEEGEELYLDYGPSWVDAWQKHVARYQLLGPRLDDNYVPAAEFNALQADEILKTITEQHKEPYPPNLVTACRFEQDWIEDEFAEEYAMIQYQSWDTQTEHNNCLLPCIILERETREVGDGSTITYTAKLVDHHHENENIEYTCHIFRRFEYIYTDIPREGIEFVEATYQSDSFLPVAFRHMIEVSEDMYPSNWLRSKVRRRSKQAEPDDQVESDHHQFKRKNAEPLFDKEDMMRKKEASPRTDL